ncbi:hypothetical protein AB6E88_03565 [Providencia hangzhouensis]
MTKNGKYKIIEKKENLASEAFVIKDIISDVIKIADRLNLFDLKLSGNNKKTACHIGVAKKNQTPY